MDVGEQPTVAIVGGGLAGLAAAAVLCERGFDVELFEARRALGGRAGSFRDPATGEVVDHCQHVGMGCCTNLLDFCRRTEVEQLFECHRRLHFFGPDGRQCDLRGVRWLPAPLHLAPSLLRLGYLTWRERIGIGLALLRLARTPSEDRAGNPTIGHWLRDQRQSERAIERFWSVVLVSALGESLDRASLSAARKVFVDGFLVNRRAYELYIPTVPLGELYGERLSGWLRQRGVALHLGQAVRQVDQSNGRIALSWADGGARSFDYVVLAAAWRRVGELLSPTIAAQIPAVQSFDQIGSAPITGVHLWLDRRITPLPHAVLVGRLSQWLFYRGERQLPDNHDPDVRQAPAHYYQVVISAAHDLATRDRDDVLREVMSDLQAVWPNARDATLRHWRMVTQRDAVFSVRPGLDQLRPAQQTPIPNLFLAGDWTATTWPATMEGAVRSGYLASEAILRASGRPEGIIMQALSRGWFVRCLMSG